jgi:DNA-binding CsgD family transcriptional regulator
MSSSLNATLTKQGNPANAELQEASSRLTRRENEVVALLVNGESNKSIARLLDIAEGTVKTHLTNIYKKLEVHTRLRASQAVASRPEVTDEQVRHALAGQLSIVGLLPRESTRSFKEGAVLFRKGDTTDAVYYVIRGTVHLVELHIDRTAGTLIGEMGLFAADRRRTATARCKTACELIKVPAQDAMRMCLQDSVFAVYVAQLVMRRVQGKE